MRRLVAHPSGAGGGPDSATSRAGAVVLLAFLAVAGGCTDDPVGPPRQVAAGNTDGVPELAASPLMRVAGLLSDGFVRPLAEALFEPATVAEVAAALSSLIGDPSAVDLQAAMDALGRLRTVPGEGLRPVYSDVGFEGSEAKPETLSEQTIVQDALTLIVDDALEILVQASAASDP